jgi:ribonuclease P protein component
MSDVPKYSLKRDSMLKRKSEIDNLFSNGKKFFLPNLMCISFVKKEIENPCFKFFMSVPKKKIKNANKRNLVKRRIKECVRLNCTEVKALCKEQKLTIHFGVIYINSIIEDFNTIQVSIKQSLEKIINF